MNFFVLFFVLFTLSFPVMAGDMIGVDLLKALETKTQSQTEKLPPETPSNATEFKSAVVVADPNSVSAIDVLEGLPKDPAEALKTPAEKLVDEEFRDASVPGPEDELKREAKLEKFKINPGLDQKFITPDQLKEELTNLTNENVKMLNKAAPAA